MKVLNREEFLKLPEGTFYCKGIPWAFEGLYIKGPSLIGPDDGMGDWIYLNPSWADGKDSGECFDTLEKSLETGNSFPCEKDSGRDGCFDKDEIFLVYEKEDLLFLKGWLDESLSLWK